MNKFFKKLTAIALAGVMCLSLCACSTDLDTMLLMKKVYDAVETTKSAEGEFECSAKGSYGIVPVKAKIEGDISYLAEKPTVWLDAEIDLGLLGDMDVDVYAEVGENSVDIYAGVEKLGDGMNWFYEKVDLPEGQSFNVSGIISLIDKGSVLVAKGEEKQINGVDAVKITLTMPGDMFAVALGNQDCIVGDVVINAWVNKADGHILRLETELSEIAKLLVSTVLEDDADNIKITSLPLEVEFDSFDTLKEIKIPQEALKAAKTETK